MDFHIYFKKRKNHSPNDYLQLAVSSKLSPFQVGTCFLKNPILSDSKGKIFSTATKATVA
jgi:hypothetical protein